MNSRIIRALAVSACALSIGAVGAGSAAAATPTTATPIAGSVELCFGLPFGPGDLKFCL
ncbi:MULTISPECIES: hypothetical protein [unclassified Nocardia]|uniref:hypothetical protein n=1 Tax=unclassified Nocardia TaxID=2637762 RepID=UPI0024A7E608|nr:MULTISPECIES: hypothetical protein [unclassified Nocardia]